MSVDSTAWLIFHVFVFVMLALDLGVFHRKSHVVSFKEAITWSGVWIAIALIFAAGVYKWEGTEAGTAFLTGYLLEKALSVDNIFVILTIFAYFKTEPKYQHKVLFWGIIGALVMRAAFIFAGVALIQKFHWVMYVFGVFLIFTGFKMAFSHGQESHPEQNPVVNFVRRVVPVASGEHEGRFFVRQGGRLMATSLFVTLLVVEFSDLIFAIDSIPAILAVSSDPFIVYTSNVFAILGLRSLYFALSGVVQMFAYLHYGLAAILAFVGTKMLIVDYYKIPVTWSLGAIGFFLAVSIVASLIAKKRADESVR